MVSFNTTIKCDLTSFVCTIFNQALSYIDKALQIDDCHVAAYLVQGYVTLSMGCPDQAEAAYRKAYQLDKREISAFQGLVECHLQMKDLKTALSYAKYVLNLCYMGQMMNLLSLG